MSDIFDIQLPDGRIIGVKANSPQEAAQGARNVLAREKGEQQGKASGVLPYVDNLVRQAANGITFGYADEIAAVLDKMTGRRKSYDESLAESRAQDKTFSQANPIASTGANIAGNVASTVAALPARLTAVGASLPGNMLKMGGVGATLGGVQGFGEGEGGFESRAVSAMLPAAAGGVIGGALPVLGIAGRAAMESTPGQWVSRNVLGPIAQKLAGAVEGTPVRSLSAAAPDGTPGVTGPLNQFADAVSDPARTGAVDRLATAFQRSGMSKEQFERRLQQLGPEAMLADLDQQFMSQARMANTMPGETRTYAKNVLEGRDRQTGPRLVSAFEGGERPPSSYELGKAFDANVRAVGAQAYQGDMVEAGLKQTPELMALYENPAVKRAIDAVMNAEKQTRIGTDRAPASPVEIMHKVKQAIWDLGFDKETARPGPMASWYRDLGTEFMDKLKRANPALAEADAAYAQAKSLPEFFESGRSLLSRGSSEKATNTSAPALADLLAGANPQQVAATKAGSTNAVRETALEGTRLARALAQRIDESAPVRDKILEIYGSPQGSKILNQAAAERQFAETSNDILRGSKTADKIAEIGDSIQLRASSGGVRPWAMEKLADILGNLSAPNETVRNQLGRMALNPNSEQNKRLLAEILAAVEKRKGGRPLASALAGSTGAQFGGP